MRLRNQILSQSIASVFPHVYDIKLHNLRLVSLQFYIHRVSIEAFTWFKEIHLLAKSYLVNSNKRIMNIIIQIIYLHEHLTRWLQQPNHNCFYYAPKTHPMYCNDIGSDQLGHQRGRRLNICALGVIYRISADVSALNVVSFSGLCDVAACHIMMS